MRSSRSPRRGAGLLGVAGLPGIPVGLLCGVLAFALAPEVGFFGDLNSAAERVIGVACALATGPALVAPLLAIGVGRRDVSVLVPGALVATVVSTVVLFTAL